MPTPEILDTIADVVVVIDQRGRILSANPAAESMLGWSPQELVGQNVSVLAGGLHGARHDGYLRRYLETGEKRVLGRPRRLEARRKDGSSLPITLAVTEAFVHGERVFTGVIRDATVDAARERDLERAQDELRVQMRVNHVLQTASSSTELVEAALHEIVSLQQLDVHHKAGVFLVDEPNDDAVRLPLADGGGLLRLTHTVGQFSDDFLERESVVPFGSCLCGRAALSGEVLVSADCYEDERHERRFHGMTPHGHYIVPIRADSRVIGVMFLYTDPHPVWDERRITLLDTLGTQIGMGLARARAQDELARQRTELQRLAHFDELTGIANRRAIFRRLQSERARSQRGGVPVSVVIFDIDHFKSINDGHGHAAGDDVLREIGKRSRDAIRPYDEVGRYGGEEFLVVLPGCRSDEAAVVAERLRVAIASEPIQTCAGPVDVSASFGVACCAADLSDEALVGNADAALYQAKRSGRNRVVIASAAASASSPPPMH